MDGDPLVIQAVTQLEERLFYLICHYYGSRVKHVDLTNFQVCTFTFKASSDLLRYIKHEDMNRYKSLGLVADVAFFSIDDCISLSPTTT